MASEYTQGVCQDGAAILKDGQLMTVEEILAELRAAPQPDTVEPVAIVEHSDYQTAAAMTGDAPKKIALRELHEGALKVGDKLYSYPPVKPDTVAVDERAEFESRVIRQRAYSNERDPLGFYVQPGLELAWRNFQMGFQAARALLDQDGLLTDGQ